MQGILSAPRQCAPTFLERQSRGRVPAGSTHPTVDISSLRAVATSKAVPGVLRDGRPGTGGGGAPVGAAP